MLFDGTDLDKARATAEQRRRMQMISQDPYASLNPRWRVRDIIAEPIRAFGLVPGAAAQQERVAQLLTQVGLSPLDGKFPHEFSGGQRQRISIARALSSNPEFLVCDEPTSALDVSVQAQILNLMKDLQQRLGLTYLFISHNLAVVRQVSDLNRGDVSRPAGRAGPGRDAVPGAAPSLYAGADGGDPRPRHDRAAAHPGRRRGAEPDQPALRLPLPPALPAGQ